MKAIFLCLFFCLTAALAVAADDPYEAALSLLPQHSHENPTVTPISLAQAEQIALQANPEIRVVGRKIAMAEAHVSGAGALDDPSVMYRGWQVPVTQPWNYNAAMNMFMIGQSIPGPGKARASPVQARGRCGRRWLPMPSAKNCWARAGQAYSIESTTTCGYSRLWGF